MASPEPISQTTGLCGSPRAPEELFGDQDAPRLTGILDPRRVLLCGRWPCGLGSSCAPWVSWVISRAALLPLPRHGLSLESGVTLQSTGAARSEPSPTDPLCGTLGGAAGDHRLFPVPKGQAEEEVKRSWREAGPGLQATVPFPSGISTESLTSILRSCPGAANIPIPSHTAKPTWPFPSPDPKPEMLTRSPLMPMSPLNPGKPSSP